ncbi:MAG: DUF2752 domain-containing protein [Chloroflexota bacterium]|nr:DUF2752 domain-containing protein [Chloroflexota bacterium]
MAGIAVAISFVFSSDGLPQVTICAFNRITGLPCPGCGLTRAFCAISHGQFAQAWDLNPFSYPLYASALLVLFRPLIALFWPRTAEYLFESRITTYLLLIAASSMIIWGIWRMTWWEGW